MEKRIEDAIKSELAHIGKLMDCSEYPPVFNMAGLVFKNVLVDFKDGPKDPKDYILDYYFKVYDCDFAKFCREFAAAVYSSIEAPLFEHSQDTRNEEDFSRWCKFCDVFNFTEFSEILQENLLTKNCVDTFEKYGQKVVMIKCHQLVWAFANFYAPKWLRDKIRTN